LLLILLLAFLILLIARVVQLFSDLSRFNIILKLFTGLKILLKLDPLLL
jgi:hypothetical protein